MKKLIPMAICYDFDGTLSPGNMQEYGFMEQISMTPNDFWDKVNQEVKATGADNIAIYMKLMISESRNNHQPFSRKTFTDYGKKIQLFKGVDSWFDRINMFGKEHGVAVKHYIISSGIKEMIEGTKIAGKFTKIYASSFLYDANGAAEWPAIVLNFTTKTRYLFEINKGENTPLNAFVKECDRAVPFVNMVYIGDGETDVPCMRIVKKEGGHSIAVYPPKSKNKRETAVRLYNEERVNIIAPSDYSVGSKIDLYIKALIEKLELEYKIQDIINDKISKKKVLSLTDNSTNINITTDYKQDESLSTESNE